MSENLPIDVFAIENPLADYYLVEENGMFFKYNSFLILTLATYTQLNPSPLDNLLAVYNLEEIAQSLARTKNDGTKGVKLRKSYKNHILDLPGKHQVPSAKPISEQMLNPDYAKTPDCIKAISTDTLKSALCFEKTPINGLPGFDTTDLAISDQNLFMRSDDMSGDDEKKKRKKKQAGGVLKRQHM